MRHMSVGLFLGAVGCVAAMFWVRSKGPDFPSWEFRRRAGWIAIAVMLILWMAGALNSGTPLAKFFDWVGHGSGWPD